MNSVHVIRSAIVYLIAAAMLTVSMPIGSAEAGMISTERVIDLASAEESRQRVLDFLFRDDIRRQLESMGVDPGEAAARVESLSDAEAAQISGRIDQLPAGQDAAAAIIGAALAVFLVLLITDIFGITNVFSFVTPVQ